MANGFTYNDIHSSSILGLVVVTNYNKDILPDMDNRFITVTNMDGVLDYGRTFKEGSFPVEFYLEGENMGDYLSRCDGVAKWLNQDTVKQFSFDAFPSRYCYARPSTKISPERLARSGRVSVDFVIPDVAWYGMPINRAVTQNQTYSYPATYKSKPVITITAKENLSFMKLTLNGTNKFVLINKAIVTDDIIVIDLKLRKVTINGVNVMPYVDVTSSIADFFLDSDYALSLNSATSTISIVYDERWL